MKSASIMLAASILIGVQVSFAEYIEIRSSDTKDEKQYKKNKRLDPYDKGTGETVNIKPKPSVKDPLGSTVVHPSLNEDNDKLQDTDHNVNPCYSPHKPSWCP